MTQSEFAYYLHNLQYSFFDKSCSTLRTHSYNAAAIAVLVVAASVAALVLVLLVSKDIHELLVAIWLRRR